jgi:hypothetical protein
MSSIFDNTSLLGEVSAAPFASKAAVIRLGWSLALQGVLL